MSELITTNLKLRITLYRISDLKKNLNTDVSNLLQIQSPPLCPLLQEQSASAYIPPVAGVSLPHQEAKLSLASYAS